MLSYFTDSFVFHCVLSIYIILIDVLIYSAPQMLLTYLLTYFDINIEFIRFQTVRWSRMRESLTTNDHYIRLDIWYRDIRCVWCGLFRYCSDADSCASKTWSYRRRLSPSTGTGRWPSRTNRKSKLAVHGAAGALAQQQNTSGRVSRRRARLFRQRWYPGHGRRRKRRERMRRTTQRRRHHDEPCGKI